MANNNNNHSPSPNQGQSVDATKDIIPESQSQETWKQQAGIDAASQVKLVKLSHMRYQHKDFTEITTFLKGKNKPSIHSFMSLDTPENKERNG